MFQQSLDIENHVIHTIDRDLLPEYTPLRLEGAKTEQVFYYSSHWNFYYTCKQLAKLLPDEKAVIVAHDWLELGMVSNLGLQNPVVQILHGDFPYYYNLAYLHWQNIDVHICVSSVIEHRLNNLLKEFNHSTIIYQRFPVPAANIKITKKDELSLLFLVRDITEDRKQMRLLPLIEQELKQKNQSVNWYIVGKGMSRNQFEQFWGSTFSERINYLGELDRVEIDSLLRECNLLILPSLSEGFPVSVVEAMKYGIVPLISYWDGAVEDLVIDNLTGFTFATQDPKAYADRLVYLANSPEQLHIMRTEARKAAELLFEPNSNTFSYEYLFKQAFVNNKEKTEFKAYGSRLDQIALPNYIVKFIRQIISCVI